MVGLGWVGSLTLLSIVVIPWAKVTSAWAGNGYRACPFEIKLTPSMDIMSTPGSLGYHLDLAGCRFHL